LDANLPVFIEVRYPKKYNESHITISYIMQSPDNVLDLKEFFLLIKKNNYD